jgi:hypothetical protein
MDTESGNRPQPHQEYGDFSPREELEDYSESSNVDQMYFTNKYQEIIEQINSMKREMEMINDENESLLKVMDETQN